MAPDFPLSNRTDRALDKGSFVTDLYGADLALALLLWYFVLFSLRIMLLDNRLMSITRVSQSYLVTDSMP